MPDQNNPNAAGAEPVAWMSIFKADGEKHITLDRMADLPFNRERWECVPLFAHPPQRPSAATDALPEQIGRLHLGDRVSDGHRLCSWGHEIPAGHPLYWPEQISQYDDSDPCCLAHAIEQSESEQGYGVSAVPSAAPDEVVEAVKRAIMNAPTRNATFSSFIYDDEALSAASAALITAIPLIRAQVVAEIVASIRATMCDCSGKFIADAIERGAAD